MPTHIDLSKLITWRDPIYPSVHNGLSLSRSVW